MIAYSAHEQPVDSVRVETLLRKGASEATIRSLRERGVYASIDRSPGVARVAGISEIGFSPRIALALKAGGTVLGYLWVISGAANLPREAEDALLRARHSLVQALQKRGSTLDVRQRQREDILADLLRGGQRDPDSLQAAARALGWYGDPPYQVMLVRDRRDSRGVQLLKETAPAISEALPLSLRGSLGDDVVVLACGSEVRVAAKVAREIAARYRRMGREVSVGLGGICDGLSLIRKSYAEASDAINFGAKFHLESGYFDYRSLAPYDLLSCLATCDKHSNYGRDAVAKLVTYDELHRSELFNTLEIFLDLYGRRKVAAARLKIHPNTLDYRIRKVREITGMDPSDPDSRLILHVWTKALHFSRGRVERHVSRESRARSGLS